MAALENIRGVLFDLDGTFADTAPDLAHALNQTLLHFGKQPLPFKQIRPVVSHGGIALIRLGFGIGPEAPDFEAKRQHLLNVYEQNLCRETTLFDGMEQVLSALEKGRIPWGIVTNKPAWLTDPLMAAMGLDKRAGCIISGDTCSNRKPHPEPILYACELIKAAPEQCIYVGDAGRDIEAGKAAGTGTVGALFGYIQQDDPPDDWQADFYINQATDLIPLLGLENE